MNKARMTFKFNEEEHTEKRVKIQHHPERGFQIQVDEPAEIKEKQLQAPSREKESLSTVSDPLADVGDPYYLHRDWSDLLGNDTIHSSLQDNPEQQAEFRQTSNYGSGTKAYQEPPRSSSGWKVFGTVTGAVVTGLLFGFVVLSFLNTGKDAGLTNPVVSPVETASLQPGQNQVTSVASVNLSTTSYYMLQYGVFSNQDGVRAATQELQKIGLAAGVDPNDPLRVYAGVSSDREEAKLLSNALKAQGVELYVKDISIPAIERLNYAGEVAVVQDYVNISNELVSMLSRTSAVLLGQDRPLALNSTEVEQLTALHQKWTRAVKQLQPGLGEQERLTLKELETAMNSAFSAFSEYNKHTSKGHLWEVQSNMMKYIMNQREILTGMSKA